MTYRVAQSCEYLGNDFWKWSVWLDGSEEELDRVRQVTWLLHPSFEPSKQVRSSRRRKFRLDASGWGTFRIRAELRLRDGKVETLAEMLDLSYPDAPGKSAPSKESLTEGAVGRVETAAVEPPRMKVFLSYGSEDSARARDFASVLEKLGATVRDASSVPPGSPVSLAVQKMIRESDGVIGVLGSEHTSPWVVTEIATAKKEAKPVVTLGPSSGREVLPMADDVVRVDIGNDRADWESKLTAVLGKLGKGSGVV